MARGYTNWCWNWNCNWNEDRGICLKNVHQRATERMEIKEAGATVRHQFKCMTSLESKIVALLIHMSVIIVICSLCSCSCSCSSSVIRVTDIDVAGACATYANLFGRRRRLDKFKMHKTACGDYREWDGKRRAAVSQSQRILGCWVRVLSQSQA